MILITDKDIAAGGKLQAFRQHVAKAFSDGTRMAKDIPEARGDLLKSVNPA
jgi:hypothetical protein